MVNLNIHVMMTLSIHCWYLSMSLNLIYPGYTCYDDPWYTCYDDPWYTFLVLIYVFIPYIPWIHMLWWPWIYIAGTYLCHYTLYTLDTHCYDDHGYTLQVLIYIIVPYIPWIHIVLMTLGIHCLYLSISFYLIYPRYTLLWWPLV